jgi:DNA (cytosine-5)-methyltransferase 1
MGSVVDAPQLDYEFLRSTASPKQAERGDSIGIVDLFAGCGGLTYGVLEGARRAGRNAHLVLAAELEGAPLDVLKATLGGSGERYAQIDLSEVLSPLAEPANTWEQRLRTQLKNASLVVAGPPCQGHSALNNHTRHDDPRNDRYLAVARVARLARPDALIVENVRGVGSDRRSAVERCIAALQEHGYEVLAQRLDLHELGVPQRRIRHVLVATLGRSFRWNLPQLPGRSVEWAIGDLLDVSAHNMFDTPSRVSPDNARRIKWLFETGAYDLPNPLRPKCHQDEHSYRSMYGRLRWDLPAQTVTSGFGSMGQGRYVHPLRPRTLTPHEAARLQFLPDYVDFSRVETRSALSTMIGNVAPPRLTITLTQELIRQGFL